MQYTKRIVTPPAAEPVSLAEAKLHLRDPNAAEDALVTTLIKAAREYCEGVLNRALITQTWDMFIDCWPSDGVIYAPMAPLVSVTHVKYVDEAGTLQTLGAPAYQVDKDVEPGRVLPAYGYTWPTLRPSYSSAVQVRFVAGYGADGTFVPQNIKQAILLAIGHWYENREDSVVGTIVATLPKAVDALLWQERVY